MFKKPFNKVVGETRQCKHCDATFHTFKPIYTCRECQNKKQKVLEQKKRAKYAKKEKYPFKTTTNEAERRFSRIHGELVAAWKVGTREALTKHYDKQLKEVEELGIMKWINDRRDKESQEQKKEKSKKKIHNDYPDTRGYNEQDSN